jgi:RNA polymerase subunit RPABC4/transcription elongation factor Spt4
MDYILIMVSMSTCKKCGILLYPGKTLCANCAGNTELFSEAIYRATRKCKECNGTMGDLLLCPYCYDSNGKPRIRDTAPVEDLVNHPKHYTRGSIEVKDFIHDQKLGYSLGNAVKYICRAGYKNPDKWEEDLEKALWYIQDFINEVNESGEFPYMETKKVPRNKD